MAKAKVKSTADNTANLGFEAKLRLTADILGRVYEYFLTQFASAEKKNGGQFDTSRCVVRVLGWIGKPRTGRDGVPTYKSR